MALYVALEQRVKVEEFARKHRIGLLTLLFTDNLSMRDAMKTRIRN